MAIWFGVDVRVDDDRVLDETWQRVRGQKFRREKPANVVTQQSVV